MIVGICANGQLVLTADSRALALSNEFCIANTEQKLINVTRYLRIVAAGSSYVNQQWSLEQFLEN